MNPPRALTRRFAYTVAVVQLGAGLTGIILGASHFAGVTYRPARHLLGFLPGEPSLWWSGLLAALAVVALASLAFRRDNWVRNMFACLCGYWIFWAFTYALAWPNPGSGPWAPWLAVMCVVGNARPVLARDLTSD